MLLPVILAGLVLIGLVVLIVRATFGGGGDVTRWAAISTIWMVIPALLLGIVFLAILFAVIYLVTKLSGLVPPYSYQIQRFANRFEGTTRRGAAMIRRPVLAVREVGAFVRSRFSRARERM